MSKNTVLVSEIFGPTLQGEGEPLGGAAYFLRMHLCPVKCKGCDSHYTWDGSERGKELHPKQLQQMLQQRAKAHPGCGLVVTGGEPLIHYKNPSFKECLSHKSQPGYPKYAGFKWMGLETSGYFSKQPADPYILRDFLLGFRYVAISPKITPCFRGMPKEIQFLSGAVQIIKARIGKDQRLAPTIVKFVVKSKVDIFAAEIFRQSLELQVGKVIMKALKFHLMPFGTTGQECTQILQDIIIPHVAEEKKPWHISPRLQCLMWDDERER